MRKSPASCRYPMRRDTDRISAILPRKKVRLCPSFIQARLLVLLEKNTFISANRGNNFGFQLLVVIGYLRNYSRACQTTPPL
ncbi:hypothetical protein J6590_082365 [Homalodisca vitripennis]|nr:hypothetical protein J6590_082365 [Homalodisca vitripennis]